MQPSCLSKALGARAEAVAPASTVCASLMISLAAIASPDIRSIVLLVQQWRGLSATDAERRPGCRLYGLTA